MIYGFPTAVKNPEYSKEIFATYIPKLKEWAYDENHTEQFNKFVDICGQKINYGFWQEDWEYAISLAIAHYICITDIDYVQSVGADVASGGVMSSRSVGGISYSYDLSRTMNDNPAYKFWQRTGYGNQLVALSSNRGWVGVLVAR